MSHSVTVRHNFESGHRLPHRPGKCQSLHGHSWWVEVTVAANLNEDGMVLDFGQLKTLVRGWVDTHLDHGLILGELDPLFPLLSAHGKVYRFPGWPTVEAVAEHLAEVTTALLYADDLPGVVTRVKVTETHVNAAEWTADV